MSTDNQFAQAFSGIQEDPKPSDAAQDVLVHSDEIMRQECEYSTVVTAARRARILSGEDGKLKVPDWEKKPTLAIMELYDKVTTQTEINQHFSDSQYACHTIGQSDNMNGPEDDYQATLSKQGLNQDVDIADRLQALFSEDFSNPND